MEWLKQVLKSLQRPTVVLKNGDGDKRRSLALHPGQKRPVGWRHVGGWMTLCGQNQWNIPRATCTERPTLSTFQKVFSNTGQPEWPWMTLMRPSPLQFQWSYRWHHMLAHQNIRYRTQILKILYGVENGWWWGWWWCSAQISETVTDIIYIITAESYNDAYCAHCNLTSKNNKWRSRLWKR